MSALIVGAGPAGCAAALALRSAGIDVTIIDQARFPRDRPGDTLHPGIEPLLRRIGALAALRQATTLRHAGHWVEWNGPPRFVPFGADARGAWRGYQISRAVFDQALLDAAGQRGAAICLGRPVLAARVDRAGRVAVETAAGPMEARVTIDASGGGHLLARQLGVPLRRHSRPLLARYGYGTGRPIARRRLPYLRADGRGWTWIAEVAPGRFHWTRVTAPDDRQPRTWRPAALRNVAPETPRGADVTWRIAAQTAAAGWYLVGDAAAVLDPSSSHGILRAIMSGMLAAHLIAAVLRGQIDASDGARAYHDQVRTWFVHDAVRMADAYAQARLFAPLEPVLSPRTAPRQAARSKGAAVGPSLPAGGEVDHCSS